MPLFQWARDLGMIILAKFRYISQSSESELLMDNYGDSQHLLCLDKNHIIIVNIILLMDIYGDSQNFHMLKEKGLS